MSYFSDRLSLYVNGIRNVDKVIEGRWNQAKASVGILDPAIEAEADRRYQICQECPFNSVLARDSAEYYSLYNQGYTTTRAPEDLHCAVCLCPLEYKSLSMTSDCGLTEYNKNHPGNIQPLKWHAVNR